MIAFFDSPPASPIKIALLQELLYAFSDKERGINEQTHSPGCHRRMRGNRGSCVVAAGAAASIGFPGETLFRYAARKGSIAHRAPTIRDHSARRRQSVPSPPGRLVVGSAGR